MISQGNYEMFIRFYKNLLAQTMITTNYTFYNTGMARLGPPQTHHVPQHLRSKLEGEFW